MNGWKRSHQIRYKINETKNVKTQKVWGEWRGGSGLTELDEGVVNEEAGKCGLRLIVVGSGHRAKNKVITTQDCPVLGWT